MSDDHRLAPDAYNILGRVKELENLAKQIARYAEAFDDMHEVLDKNLAFDITIFSVGPRGGKSRQITPVDLFPLAVRRDLLSHIAQFINEQIKRLHADLEQKKKDI